MIKIINFIIPFLLEMLFGKKEEKEKEDGASQPSKLKKTIVYLVMMLSFSFNYFAINRIYTVSMSYIGLKKEKALLQAIISVRDDDKSRADQLEKSLEFCMSNTYQQRRALTQKGSTEK